MKKQVWERDGERCSLCQGTDGPFHIDHIFPWSKGGSNDLENLQVLCASCNLRKSAQIAGAEPIIPAIAELLDAAKAAERRVPQTVTELGAVMNSCVRNGHSAEALRLAWALEDHPDATPEMLMAIQSALDHLQGPEALESELLGLITAEPLDLERLRTLAESDNPQIARRAAITLAEQVETDAERERFARQARNSQDPDSRLQSRAAIVIAELTEDDDEWRAELLFAIEHGGPITSSVASLMLGAEIDDNALAYEFLERAIRSPLVEVGAEAAQLLSEILGEEDPELAARYREMADELKAQSISA